MHKLFADGKKLRVLITGAFGTWGNEFTRVLLEEGHEIIAVGRDEKAAAEYKRKFPNTHIMLMDFQDVKFSGMKCDLLIHLAAYKHIDLCEVNIVSAIENNVTKTAKLFADANNNDVEILFISTDKACDPISVYGMTKALGERLAWNYGGAVARSGNIIGSNGSVVHVWRQMVQDEKPLSVTDMDMQRYFIKVEDAIAIAWEGFKQGKRLTLVDKGGKLKLGDIINKVLEEFGYTLETYKPGVNIIGLRPGERLVDEITWDQDYKYLES